MTVAIVSLMGAILYFLIKITKLVFTLKFSRPTAVSTKVTKRMGSSSSLPFKYRWNLSTNWNGHTQSKTTLQI